MESERAAAMAAASDERAEETRGWMIVAGITLLALGTAAIVYSGYTDAASVFVFGWLLPLGGVIQIMHAFRIHASSEFFPHLVDGVVRATVGTYLMLYPTSSADALTLLLSYYFAVSGVFRAFGSIDVQFPGWGWSLASGLGSVALALVLAMQAPGAGMWFIGLSIGVDLILYGTALVMVAVAKTPASSYA